MILHGANWSDYGGQREGILTMNYPTDFIEANVLLAIVEDDTETAEEILADMTDFQIKALHEVAAQTMMICGRILHERKSESDLETTGRSGALTGAGS